MAKAKTLAALAGLAGLAYAMRNKGKDDAGKSADSSSYAPSSNMTPIKVNEEAPDGSAYATRSNMTPMQGVGDATNNPIVKPKTITKAASVKPAPSDRREMESGMSRGTRPADPRNLEAGMSRGTRPADPRNLEAGMSRGRRMASGGTASSRADGCATKGKTKGRFV